MANHSGPVKYYYFLIAYKYIACIGSQLSSKILFALPNRSQVLGKNRREVKKVMAGGRRTLKEEREW